MRIILILLRKDLANFTRDKAALSLSFLIPIALIYIFGQVFGLNRKSTGPTGIPVAVVNQSDAPATQKLVNALKNERAFRVQTKQIQADKSEQILTEEIVRRMMLDNQLRYAVVIPHNVIRDDAIGVRIKILSSSQNEIEAQTVNGLLQKAIFSSVPELLGQSLQAQAKREIGEQRLGQFNDSIAEAVSSSFGTDKETVRRGLAAGDFGFSALPSSNAATVSTSAVQPSSDALANLVKIDTEMVTGKVVKSPTATRMVGGWAIMFLLFTLSGSATSFFEEKKTGIFQRLLSAPVRRSQLLLSRFLFGIGLGLVQLMVLFMAGRLLYGIDVFGNFLNLAIVCIAAAAACTAFAMLLVSLTRTAAAASGLATFLVLMMSACGGAWFPVSFFPPIMQEVAKFTLVYWALEGFAQVLWAGHTFIQLLPTLGILTGIAAVVMSIAVWRFSRGHLFD